MKLVREADVSGKRVLVRADLDVPLEEFRDKGQEPKARVADGFRLEACLPTLEYLVRERARVIICGHLDRPGGRMVEELRMDPVAGFLSNYLGPLHKSDEVVGPVVEDVVSEMEEGDILLLENLRFNPGEKVNDSRFAKNLASLADIYVNECFATSHREHASIVGVPEYLPAYAGFRLKEEIEKLTEIKSTPRFGTEWKDPSSPRQRGGQAPGRVFPSESHRPLVFIIGGAKTETKVPLVRKIAQYSDKILLGGKLMFERSLENIPNVVFPVDAVGIYDIGPKTVEMFKEVLEKARTVVWNGPLGKFEEPRYARGTRIIADYLTRIDADVVAGGGDTLAALEEFGLRDKMGFVSTGGGAMLAFLAGEELPGIEVLG